MRILLGYTPGGTPRDIIMRLNTEINNALTDLPVAKLFVTSGMEPSGGTPEELGKLLREVYERWKKLIAATKLSAE